VDEQKKNPLGSTGETVRINVRRLREAQRLGYAEMARRLKSIGRTIPELGLRRIEEGNRRVDVDDLMALAVVLDVAPIALLMPEITDEEWDDTPIGATGFQGGITAQRLWECLRGSVAPPGSSSPIIWLGRSIPWPAISVISHGPIPDEDEA